MTVQLPPAFTIGVGVARTQVTPENAGRSCLSLETEPRGSLPGGSGSASVGGDKNEFGGCQVLSNQAKQRLREEKCSSLQGIVAPVGEFINREVWKFRPYHLRGLGACVGRYEVLMRQMRSNNAEIKDFKRFVVGLTQLCSRSRAGLPAAHAGSLSSTQELGAGDTCPKPEQRRGRGGCPDHVLVTNNQGPFTFYRVERTSSRNGV